MMSLLKFLQLLPQGWGVLIEPDQYIENAYKITIFSSYVQYIGKAFNSVTISKELLEEPDETLLTVTVKEVILKMQHKIKSQDE
jgi:hypothetical protein